MKKSAIVVTRNAQELAAALGLSPADAIEWEVRSNLNQKIIEAVHESGLTHAQVAKLAKTSRTRLTALLHHDSTGVSTDLMVRILAALGYRAKMTFIKVRRAA